MQGIARGEDGAKTVPRENGVKAPRRQRPGTAGESRPAPPAAAAAVAVSAQENLREVTLSNGIVMTLRPVSWWLMADVQRQYPEPKPPVIMLEDKGREEENPEDPAYQEARVHWRNQVNEAVNDVMLLMGTSPKVIPPGLDSPDDESWVKQLAAVHVIVPDDQYQRYLCWLKYYAIRTIGDLSAMTIRVKSLAFTLETEVLAALASFPGGDGRPAGDGDKAAAGDS